MQNRSSIPEPRSSKEKRDFWLAHIDAWKTSSKSQSRYCNEHGLKLSSFGYWRTLHMPKKPTPLPFVKMTSVATGSSVASTQQHFIEIKLSNNIVAKIPLAIGMKEIICLIQGLGGFDADISTRY